jgi:hypothetical protein
MAEKRSDLTDVKAVAVAVFVFRLRGAQTLVAGFLPCPGATLPYAVRDGMTGARAGARSR